MNPTATNLLVFLVTAHVIGDFVLQADKDVEAKRRRQWGVFLKHVVIHAVLVYLLVGDWRLWSLPLILAASQ